jgi:hypothetical protein
VTSGKTPSREVLIPEAGTSDGGRTTRLVATLVLVPAVPMLLLSVAALALFYIAPTRFGSLIARLPGEAFIRTALFFAPATLFAVVVLAVLYALDKPAGEIAAMVPARRMDQTPTTIPRVSRSLYSAPVAKAILFVATPALLFATAVRVLSFVAPGRFDRLIEPLPGDRYLRSMTNLAPILLFAVVLIAAYFAFSSAVRAPRDLRGAQLKRLAVSSVLVSAVPALLMSLGALGVLLLSPERFDRLIARLPYDEFVRLALIFSPAVLLAVVLLAILYLSKPQAADETQPIPTRRPQRRAPELQSLRSILAQWVLVGGLILSAVVGLGLLGAILYIALR